MLGLFLMVVHDVLVIKVPLSRLLCLEIGNLFCLLFCFTFLGNK